jgi:hypothetical protein
MSQFAKENVPIRSSCSVPILSLIDVADCFPAKNLTLSESRINLDLTPSWGTDNSSPQGNMLGWVSRV